MNLFKCKGGKKTIYRDVVTVKKGSGSLELTIVNTVRLNARLKFTNKSTIGDATNVNNGNFGLQYSEDGTNWVDYGITDDTVTYVSGKGTLRREMPSPSGNNVSGERWQWNNGNSVIFYTNVRHKWWRYFFSFRNTSYASNYWVENYLEDITDVPVIVNNITI